MKILTSIISGVALATLLLTAARAQAQVTFSVGPQVGENLARQHIADGTSTTNRVGLLVGLQASIRREHFAVQPALLYSQLGYKYATTLTARGQNNLPNTTADFATTVRLDYLTLPLNFTYALQADGDGPQFFAGPYVSVLLGGKYQRTTAYQAGPTFTESSSVAVADNPGYAAGYAARRFDAGVQGGVGFRYAGLLLQVAYSLGLRTVTPTYPALGSHADGYNRAFQFTVSYLFSPKS